MKTIATILLTAVIGVLGAFAYAYSGAFDVAADQPHGKLFLALADTARERSIKRQAKDIEVPNLDDPQKISTGASEYAEMCAGCHLAPGMADNELRPGLYPQPPNLSEAPDDQGPIDAKVEAAHDFWVIKHGIKMSAMPAWGKTHDDQTIWAIVAFLHRMPSLSPAEYVSMTANSESAHEEAGHGDGDHAMPAGMHMEVPDGGKPPAQEEPGPHH